MKKTIEKAMKLGDNAAIKKALLDAQNANLTLADDSEEEELKEMLSQAEQAYVESVQKLPNAAKAQRNEHNKSIKEKLEQALASDEPALIEEALKHARENATPLALTESEKDLSALVDKANRKKEAAESGEPMDEAKMQNVKNCFQSMLQSVDLEK